MSCTTTRSERKTVHENTARMLMQFAWHSGSDAVILPSKPLRALLGLKRNLSHRRFDEFAEDASPWFPHARSFGTTRNAMPGSGCPVFVTSARWAIFSRLPIRPEATSRAFEDIRAAHAAGKRLPTAQALASHGIRAAFLDGSLPTVRDCADVSDAVTGMLADKRRKRPYANAIWARFRRFKHPFCEASLSDIEMWTMTQILHRLPPGANPPSQNRMGCSCSDGTARRPARTNPNPSPGLF